MNLNIIIESISLGIYCFTLYYVFRCRSIVKNAGFLYVALLFITGVIRRIMSLFFNEMFTPLVNNLFLLIMAILGLIGFYKMYRTLVRASSLIAEVKFLAAKKKSKSKK